MQDGSDTGQQATLCRLGRTVRQTVTKLLRMIEGQTKRLAEERDMSHLATGTNYSFAIEMEHRTGNIQQRSTACAFHEGCGILSNEIHHDGWAQQTYFAKGHAADSTNLLLKL